MGRHSLGGDVELAEFRRFVEEVEPRLRRALTSLRGTVDGLDATAEALSWAWEHWDRVVVLENPAGYLYRVGASRSRPRRSPRLEQPASRAELGFEPGLVPALERLPERQRVSVVLVHGCGWTMEEVAEALDLSRATLATHVARALARLRAELGAEQRAGSH